jgi:hypothetical protein
MLVKPLLVEQLVENSLWGLNSYRRPFFWAALEFELRALHLLGRLLMLEPLYQSQEIFLLGTRLVPGWMREAWGERGSEAAEISAT